MPPASLTERALFHATYWASFTALTFGLSFRVGGRSRVPLEGPALLVANHQSFIDPVLVGQAAPRRVRYLARHTLFQVPLLGPVIRAYGARPIDRGFGKEGLRMVLGELDAGHAVVVFAEGERTPTGALQPFKPGVALLIKKVACPIIPVGVAGAFAMWPRQRKLPAPEPLFGPPTGRSVAVAFGPPVAPEPLRDLPREELLATLEGHVAAAQREAEALRRR